MSCMTTFGHSCRPTMSKSWTFVLDLKVKVFDTSAAYNKFLGTIFLFGCTGTAREINSRKRFSVLTCYFCVWSKSGCRLLSPPGKWKDEKQILN